MIVVLGIIIGGGAYGIYRYTNKRSGGQTLPENKQIQPTAVQKSGGSEPTTAKSKTTGLESKEQGQKGNFSKEGALFFAEEGWTLLWDEPGRLALNVKLKFTEQSICILGSEKKDCGLINMGPQSYDRVKVEGNRNDGEVTVIKLEEVPLPQ